MCHDTICEKCALEPGESSSFGLWGWGLLEDMRIYTTVIQGQKFYTLKACKLRFFADKNISVTRSSWLNCALRDDEAVYWVSIGHYEAVAVGI